MPDAPAPSLSDVIADAAEHPQRVQVGAESAQEHPLPDLIAADRHLAAKRAAARGLGGVRFTRFLPGGAG